MKVRELIREFPAEVLSGEENLDRTIVRGFTGDMMSHALVNGGKGDVWITFQTRINVAAIATKKEMACVILVQNRKMAGEALKKAREIGLPVLSTPLSAFETIGRLYRLGIGGS